MRNVFKTIMLGILDNNPKFNHSLLTRSIIMLNYSIFTKSSICNSKQLLRRTFSNKYKNMQQLNMSKFASK